MDGVDDDKAYKRLLCLDTESSLCMSFEKSLRGDKMATSPSSKASIANGPGSAQQGQFLNDDKRPPSSGSHFVPRILEIHGSSDSQLKISSLDLAGKLGGNMASPDDAQSISTNDESMATADMVLTDDDNDNTRVPGSGIVGGASTDMELQAAIEQMLQGYNSSVALQPGAYHLTDHSLPLARDLQGTGAVAGAAVIPCALGVDGQKPTLVHRIAQRGRGLGSRVVQRFTRHADDAGDLRSYSLGDTSRGMSKREASGSTYTEHVGGKTTCVEYIATPERSDGPSRMAKFLAPVVSYMQRRPIAALGTVLGVLVALLAIIVVILVVGVFPYLMRATLQDVSFSVSSVRAVSPFQVGRSLSLNKPNTVEHTSEAARAMRLAVEHDEVPRGGSVPNGDQRLNVFGKRDGHAPVQHAPVSAARRDSADGAHDTVGHHHAHSAQHQAESGPRVAAVPLSSPPAPQLAPTHGSHVRHASSAASEARGTGPAAHSSAAAHAAVVTLSVTAVRSLNHAVSPLQPMSVDNVLPLGTVAAATTAAGTVQLPAASNVASQDVLPAPPPAAKALDNDKEALSYTMQFGGSLDSGGPIGIDIEFIEPLRMYWRDVEIGAIQNPEKLHVPGHGTAEWSWAPFTVSALGPSDAVMAPSSGRVNKKLVVPRSPQGAELVATTMAPSPETDHSAQRREVAGGALHNRATGDSTSTDMRGHLADWFATIQAHGSFTMEWRSRVRVSAMGMHTSHVNFEKVVRVSCLTASQCAVGS